MEKRGIISRETPVESVGDVDRQQKIASDLPESAADVARMESGPTRRLIDAVTAQARSREQRRPG